MEDSREALAADIRTWLEWQKSCGTQDWMVSDIQVWEELKNISSVATQVSARQRPQAIDSNITKEKARKKEKEADKDTRQSPASQKLQREPKPDLQHNLKPWWKSIIDRRNDRPQFNLNQIPHGADGLQQAFAFREANCQTKQCMWGVGRPDAPVVLIEGHAKPLAGAGLKMLGDMRAKVLQLPKEKLYWIPMKRGFGCYHCDTMALAQLYAIQPKAVLVFGMDPLDILRVDDREAALRGEDIQIETNGRHIPAICTIHPMQLVEEPRKKAIALRALRNFRFLLNKLNI